MARAEVYRNAFTNPPDRLCIRHWAHPLVLIGGNLNGPDDWAHLRDGFGVRSVLNVDHRSEAWIGIPALSEVPVEDDGNGFPPGPVRHALSFARMQVGIGPVYVHCHIGVSRSPAFAYGIMRWALDMEPADALAALNQSGGEYGTAYESVPKHRTYVNSVERAISGNKHFLQG